MPWVESWNAVRIGARRKTSGWSRVAFASMMASRSKLSQTMMAASRSSLAYRAGHSPGVFVVPYCEVDKKEESRGQRSVTESLPDRGTLRQFVRSWVRKYPLNLASLAKVVISRICYLSPVIQDQLTHAQYLYDSCTYFIYLSDVTWRFTSPI
jgi:hypothetical protein